MVEMESSKEAGLRFKTVRVTPADRRYPDLVRGLNQRWVGNPEAVYLVSATAQVVDVVQRAVHANKRISVHSGGHCFEDFVFNPSVQVVVDMSEFNEVYFDRTRNAFAVEAGARLLDVYEKLYRLWGVTLPAGVCYTVGAGGHFSGGGFGFLSRQYGLSIDHLYAVEVVVVDADGTARAAMATRERSDPNRDLWWAHTGGGGGNFGVVTRYWFRSPGATGTDPAELLPTPPAEVLVTAIAWPWQEITEERFTMLVKNYADWHAAHGAPGNPFASLFAMLILSHRSNGQIVLVAQFDATILGATRLFDDFIVAMTRGVGVEHEAMTTRHGEFGPMPELFTPRRLPWLQAARMFGTTSGTLNDPTLHIDYKSAYMRRTIPEHQIGVFYKYLTSPDIDNPTAAVQLHSYGGQINAVSPEATASAHRDSVFKLIYFLQWMGQDDDEKSLRWLRELYQEVYADTGGVPVPNLVTDGCFINYPDIDLNDPRFNTSSVPWQTLYYKDNYPQLQQVKARWDPRDTFRHGQSIRLP